MALLPLLVSLAAVSAGTTDSVAEHGPRTYCSSSGKWRVRVEPDRPEGGGPALYFGEHEGERVWETWLPFTLCDAVIDDTGYVAGYSYEVNRAGTETWSVTAVISPAGRVRVARPEWHEYRRCMQPTAPPVFGLFLDSNQGRFVVRGVDGWTVRDLRTGDRVTGFDLSPVVREGSFWQASPRILFAGVVPGKELYVTVGVITRYDRRPREHDLVLELFDPEGRWLDARTFPRELPASYWDLPTGIEELDGSFAIQLPNSSTRVEFGVEFDEREGWQLHERSWRFASESACPTSSRER